MASRVRPQAMEEGWLGDSQSVAGLDLADLDWGWSPCFISLSRLVNKDSQRLAEDTHSQYTLVPVFGNGNVE